ncbi:MAG: MGMT family protein [Symbiobacteriaceae bacterium]|nr:MGMT family protein [Symbiobacteriaceae bacterium]
MAHQGLFKEIYAIVSEIPYGQVMTYGQIAGLLGNPRFARRVGQAMYAAPEELNLPCHRVVKANGSLCHPPFGELQRELLGAEGVGFLPGNRVDLLNYRWRG